MKCPKCGFNSFDYLDTCRKCGSSIDVKPGHDVFYKSYEPSRRYEEAKTKRLEAPEHKRLEEAVAKQSEEDEKRENVEEIVSSDNETNPILENEAQALTADKVNLNLAGFSARLISLLFDLIVIFALTAFVLAAGIYIATNDSMLNASYSLNFIASIFFFLLMICSSYFVFLEGYGGKTIGKMIMGIRVIGDDGGSVDIVKAFTRWAVSFFSASFLFIGFLWALFDSRSQTWHDKIAGTIVIIE